jgi:hypothetical protein
MVPTTEKYINPIDGISIPSSTANCIQYAKDVRRKVRSRPLSVWTISFLLSMVVLFGIHLTIKGCASPAIASRPSKTERNMENKSPKGVSKSLSTHASETAGQPFFFARNVRTLGFPAKTL